MWALPYSFALEIDAAYAAEAALRCGCVCSALVLAEMADEGRRAQQQVGGCPSPLTPPTALYSAR